MPNPVKTRVINTLAELKEILSTVKKEGLSLGFVPTMGALHDGHLALIERCKNENSICLASIFVNPSQFNSSEDFKRYPRNLEKDTQLLEKAGCELIFTPIEADIYSGPAIKNFEFGEMDKVMEGKYRPGHFKGVADIVSRFVKIIEPDKLYLGQKDFQQVAILREVLKQMDSNTRIVECPTIREENGLAMSSRNELLNSKDRNNAGIIYRTLCEIKEGIASIPIETLIKKGMQKINSVNGFQCEYLLLVNANTLEAVTNNSDVDTIQACTAVKVGKVRLIDNLRIK